MADYSSIPSLINPLFVPGNNELMLKKALRFSSSALMPDLEDSVPKGQKSRARDIVSRIIPELSGDGRMIIPRVNPLSSQLTKDDVYAVVGEHIGAISIGKISSAEELFTFEKIVVSAERARGLVVGQIGILPWIETALGVVNAFKISVSSTRVRWVAFGADDLTRDLGVPRPHDTGKINNSRLATEPALAYSRATVTIGARGAGIQALDSPYTAFLDQEGLKKDATQARMCGFTGKFAIHPDQLALIHQAFAPSDDEIAHALRVVREWESAASNGRGVISVDERMVDVPVVKRAKALLASTGHGSSR